MLYYRHYVLKLGLIFYLFAPVSASEKSAALEMSGAEARQSLALSEEEFSEDSLDIEFDRLNLRVDEDQVENPEHYPFADEVMDVKSIDTNSYIEKVYQLIKNEDHQCLVWKIVDAMQLLNFDSAQAWRVAMMAAYVSPTHIESLAKTLILMTDEKTPSLVHDCVLHAIFLSPAEHCERLVRLTQDLVLNYCHQVDTATNSLEILTFISRFHNRNVKVFQQSIGFIKDNYPEIKDLTGVLNLAEGFSTLSPEKHMTVFQLLKNFKDNPILTREICLKLDLFPENQLESLIFLINNENVLNDYKGHMPSLLKTLSRIKADHREFTFKLIEKTYPNRGGAFKLDQLKKHRVEDGSD